MKKYQSFSSENVQDLEMKFSIYLHRHVFVMICLREEIRKSTYLVPPSYTGIYPYDKKCLLTGYGVFGGGQAVSSSSHFRTASISKVLTAVGIMRLKEDARLDHNTKVFGPSGIP